LDISSKDRKKEIPCSDKSRKNQKNRSLLIKTSYKQAESQSIDTDKTRIKMREEHFYDNFEDWEADAYFINKEDWKGLLQLREKKARNNPNDLSAQQRFGEALVLNKKYSEAIDFLTPLYKIYHTEGFGIQEIMDSLVGLGKTEKDFNWATEPKIYRLNNQTLELCIKTLKGKRKHIDLFKVYEPFYFIADYIAFSQDELAEFLLKYTEIFSFEGDRSFPEFLTVKLRK
jgi:hypothetical protein